MKKRTTKKLSKASGLKLMTQAVADRANRGGVQIQSSYRSREKSEETTAQSTTGERTAQEKLSSRAEAGEFARPSELYQSEVGTLSEPDVVAPREKITAPIPMDRLRRALTEQT